MTSKSCLHVLLKEAENRQPLGYALACVPYMSVGDSGAYRFLRHDYLKVLASDLEALPGSTTTPLRFRLTQLKFDGTRYDTDMRSARTALLRDEKAGSSLLRHWRDVRGKTSLWYVGPRSLRHTPGQPPTRSFSELNHVCDQAYLHPPPLEVTASWFAFVRRFVMMLGTFEQAQKIVYGALVLRAAYRLQRSPEELRSSLTEGDE